MIRTMKTAGAVVAIAALLAASIGANKAAAEGYVGGHAGWQFANTDVKFGATDLNGLGADGMLGGLRVGYDVHLLSTPFFFGVMADYNWSDAKFQINQGAAFSASIHDTYGISARAGMQINGGPKVYLLAGYKRADAVWSVPNISLPTFGGVMGGIGTEWTLAKGLTFGLETQITQYASESVAGTGLSLQPRDIAALGVLTFHFGALPSSSSYVPLK